MYMYTRLPHPSPEVIQKISRCSSNRHMPHTTERTTTDKHKKDRRAVERNQAAGLDVGIPHTSDVQGSPFYPTPIRVELCQKYNDRPIDGNRQTAYLCHTEIGTVSLPAEFSGLNLLVFPNFILGRIACIA